MKFRTIALACLMAFAAMPALAADPANNQVEPMKINAQSREAFAAVAAEVRKEMEPEGRFEYVTPAERTKVEDGLRRIGLLFENAPTVDQMNKSDQVAVFNQQEIINAVLKQKDGERVICKRERKTGSNLSTTSCMTFAQRERIRRDNQNELNRIQKGAPYTSQ